MKAIQTTWKGYRFRSRLEARWAVFLSAIGAHWEYEAEGYELADGTRYLPDFWLPNEQAWIEVKGARPSPTEMGACALLADESGLPVIMVVGAPGYELIECPRAEYREPTHKEIVFLGYNPPSADWRVWDWVIALEAREGDLALEQFLVENGLIQPGIEFPSERDRLIFLIEKDREYYRNKYGREHQNWGAGLVSVGGLDHLVLKDGRLALGNGPCRKMAAAANAARSARFEHGESPA
jgi:hypothetical protein